jgi:hypothetical protein
MKKIALLLYISIISSVLFAQSEADPINIGYFCDFNKTMFDGVYDLQYNPKELLYVSHDFGSEYTPGCYYTLFGEQIQGLIIYSRSNSYFKFKSDEEADPVNIKPDDCLGFMVGKDSFAVIQNFESIKILGKQTTKDKVFAEVIDQFEQQTIYVYYWKGYQNITQTFLLSKDAGKTFLTINYENEINPQASEEVFGINDQLLKGVNDERKLARNLHTYLKLYKYNLHFKSGKPIYLNSSFDETNKANEAVYYLKVEDIKDTHYRISCYRVDQVKIYDGQFTNFYPHKRDGNYTLYYPSGEVRKNLIYKDNKFVKGTDYYLNGTIHREFNFEESRIFYTRVNDTNGNNILNTSFSGKQNIYDSINKRSITYEYYFRFLTRTYYNDENGTRIYQICQKSSAPVSIENLQKTIQNEVFYPQASLNSSSHGVVLVKLIIDPMGMVKSHQIVRSTDYMLNTALENFLSKMTTRKYWTIPMDKEVKITQEIVLPIDFSINSSSVYRSHNFVNPTQVIIMMQQNMGRPGGMGGF